MTDLTTTTAPAAVTENWDTQKANLRARFSILTDEDLQHEEGKKEEMLERLQTRLGKTKEELATIIATL